MARLRRIRGTASLAAQLLGLCLAILLLTPAGLSGIAKFGFLQVLLAALAFFVVAEVTVVILAARYHGKSTTATRRISGPGSGLNSDPRQSSARS